MMSPAYRELRNLSQEALSRPDRLLHEMVAVALVWAYTDNTVGGVPRLAVIQLGFEMDNSEWDITRDTMAEYVVKEHKKDSNRKNWAMGCLAWIRELDSYRAFT